MIVYYVMAFLFGCLIGSVVQWLWLCKELLDDINAWLQNIDEFIRRLAT